MTWTESDGPRVRPPQRLGFGTSVIRRALSGPVGGSARLDWLPQGLRCEILVPADGARPAPDGFWDGSPAGETSPQG
jgi:two-component sensor histidine kinase